MRSLMKDELPADNHNRAVLCLDSMAYLGLLPQARIRRIG